VLASVRSSVLEGVDGRVVTVEVHVARGLPSYTVVGLPDTSGRESRERVRAALLSSELAFPQARITVNLAPAGVRKVGAGLELAVAVALLGASEQLPPCALEDLALLGELGLDGRVRPVVGVLGLVDALVRAGHCAVVVPEKNAFEATLVPGAEVRVARSVGELHACLKGELPWPPLPEGPRAAATIAADEPCDLADVRGLSLARDALAAAAAGSHHLLMIGPPGAGKTMLARRIETIMPALPPAQALEVTKIHSAAGIAPHTGLCTARPFRAPHHSASAAALIGGGSPRPRPGEITLAHHGTLFLDELGEFPPMVLDALRQPLEERVVRVSRAWGTIEFPAGFLLVACCNPCPCGRPDPQCQCSDTQRARYLRRLSAPLLDRFDVRLEVTAADADAPTGEPSSVVRERVQAAVARQEARLAGTPWRRNAHVPAGALAGLLPLAGGAERTWHAVCRTRRLTGRGAARVRRLAWTLADLEGAPAATADHVELAALLRGDVR